MQNKARVCHRVVWAKRALSGSTYIERTKNKTKLPVPLNDMALQIAQRNVHRKFPIDFLFIDPRTKRGYARKGLWNIWRTYSETGVKLYEATRHSCCTQIVPLTDPYTAQRLMRHKDRRSTDNYYHAYSETLLDVVQRMDNVRSLPEKNRSDS